MGEPNILVAAKSALLYVEGRRVAIRKDATTVRAGHPILAGRAHLFRPLTVDFDHQPPAREPVRAPAPAPDPKAVRQWAARAGVDVPARGKLPAEVVERYQAAREA